MRQLQITFADIKMEYVNLKKLIHVIDLVEDENDTYAAIRKHEKLKWSDPICNGVSDELAHVSPTFKPLKKWKYTCVQLLSKYDYRSGQSRITTTDPKKLELRNIILHGSGVIDNKWLDDQVANYVHESVSEIASGDAGDLSEEDETAQSPENDPGKILVKPL